MNRKHIYIGATALVVVLGACGGYYLFAGPGEVPEPKRTKADSAKPSAGADAPIEVPPMAADDAFSVPAMPDAAPPASRYAMNQGSLDPGYVPVAGGVSALPATEIGPASEAEGTVQPPLPGGRYGLPSPPVGDERETIGVAQEDPALHGAAIPAHDAVSTDQAGQAEPPPLGQDSPEIGEQLGNSLRDSARAVFASDSADGEAAGAIGRYDAEDVAAESGEGGLVAEAGQASPPAPIPFAQAGALPEYADPVPAEAAAEGQHLATDSSNPAASPTGQGWNGPSGQPAAAAGDVHEQPSSLAEGFASADDAAAVPATPFGSSALAAASNPAGSSIPSNDPPVAPLRGGSLAAATPRPLQNDFDAAPAAQEISVASPPFATGGEGFAAGGGPATGRPGDETLEGPQAPQLSIEKTAPNEVQVGKNCTFTIVVRNTGRAAARDVLLVDEIPLGTQLVNTSPRASVAGGRIEWQFGTLEPGASETVEVELLPVEEGEIGSVATVHFAAAASVRTHSTRPQLQVRTEVAPTVMIGQPQVVRITLTNPGSGDATGVMLLENVPPGMSHPHGPSLEFEVGTLRAGQTRELELTLTAQTKGVFQNRIVATGDANLVAEDVADFEVVAPEIAVSVEGPERKYLELPATFTVAVENRGTAAATDVELVGKLPPGLEFVSADKYGEYDEATRSVYWSLAELPPSQRGEVKLVAMPVDLGDQRLEFKAGADLGIADQAESTLRVEGLAALKSEVTDVTDPIEVGGQSSYEIRVVNQGSKAATNVVVVARFPEGIEAVRAEGPTDCRVEPKQVVFAPLAQLSAKADTTYRIDVTGVRPGDQRVHVQIMTDDLAQPINEEESTRVYADQ